MWVDVAPELGLDFEIDGMSIVVADLTGDGILAEYLSDIGENEFVVGTGVGFTPGFGSGAARIRPPGAGEDVVSNSWVSGAVDVNLDGIVDLTVVNGGFPFFDVPIKIDGAGIEMNDPPAIFLGLGGGRYADTWQQSGLGWTGPGRGLAVGDIDNDGDIDFIVTRLEAGPHRVSQRQHGTVAHGQGGAGVLIQRCDRIGSDGIRIHHTASRRPQLPWLTCPGGHRREAFTGGRHRCTLVRRLCDRRDTT